MKTRKPKSERFLCHVECGPSSVLPGWRIAEAKAPLCPIAVVLLPAKCTVAQSKRVERITRLMTVAPHLEDFARRVVAILESGDGIPISALMIEGSQLLEQLDGGKQ